MERGNLIMNELFDNLYDRNYIKTIFQSGEKISSFLQGYYKQIVSLKELDVLQLDFGQKPCTPELIDEYFETRDQRKSSKTISKKMIGSITAEYFRSKIEEALQHLQQYPDYKVDYKVSENNVYVKGCHIEFDFLILKSDALKQGGFPVYKADDVVAVLECKSNGIYHEYYRGKDDQTQKDTYDLKNFVDAYLKLLKENKQIKMGYMSLSENAPRSIIGKSNFIYGMLLYVHDKFKEKELSYDGKWYYYISRCHFPAKKKDIYSSDQQWTKFISNLIPQCDI